MDASNDIHGAWVAIYVRANHERAVADQLAVYGYEPFLPTRPAPARRLKRRAGAPLFPGYVFCRYRVQPAFRILQVPGVVRILTHGTTPAVLCAEELDAIRRIVSVDVLVEPWRFLEVGRRVRITAGPLRGLEGTLVALGNHLRMVVSVTMLRRSVAVKVDAEQLTLLPDVA
jgi:transcriptional antiterminator NusG